ncbi:MAG: prepilin-type N-terminal cleavage/methylation domain-containing protein [Elusimicrobia bacterium]|nr:prepilin-type N-terminal cleavage/methylation domain-containing protein [Elusimicrobiota bacterium]
MKKLRKGFTLIELMVVVIIMGILASMSIPYYHKTVETSRATDAVALGNLLAAGYRMYLIDNPGTSLSGSITNSCNGLACASASGACRIVACKYVAEQDWTNASYSYSIGGSCGGGIAACVSRTGGSGAYASWGYNFNLSGGCSAYTADTPACPRF